MKNMRLLLLFLFVAGNSFAQQITFQKTFGGASGDEGYSVQQTTDSGYIVAGNTYSFGAGSTDVYLMKSDANGVSLWTKTFGGIGIDIGFTVQQTLDGGYIVAGYTNGFGAGSIDVYLIKTDSIGDSIWTKTFGGTASERIHSIKQTTDGGYIIAGYTRSFGVGNDDVYLIKTDANGDSLWTKTFGGTNDDWAWSVQQTMDGGYVITGYTDFGAGYFDVYLIKTNANGNLAWTKTFGGANFDYGNAVQQTNDGGYIILGLTESFGAGLFDIYLIRTNANGDSLWTKTFGGVDSDGGNAVNQTTDGGYIITGSTFSFGSGNYDVYLIRTDDNGNLLWSKTFGGIGIDIGVSVQQTSDGGYILTGHTNSFGAGGYDVYLIKTDSNGNSGCNEGSTTTIVTTPATIVTNPTTIVTSTATIVTNPATIVGSGGTVTTLCTTTDLTPNPSPKERGVAIAPNPTTNNFTITFPHIINKGVIEIYNVLGEKVMEESVVNTSVKEIRMKDVAAGIYVVKVGDGENEYVKKLIVAE